MDIYIKPLRKYALEGKHAVYLKDISEVVADKTIMNKIKNIKLMTVYDKEKKSFLISVTDIVRAISEICPGSSISNLGEADTIIEYSPQKEKENPYLKWAKIVFVVLILGLGSATAIMSFQTESQIPNILNNFYYMFFREKVEKPMLMEIPYSLGIAVGIIVFFNHFGSTKTSKDPTPIEVEMALYEEDVSSTQVNSLGRQAQEEGGKG